jgi:hypothetical protein
MITVRVERIKVVSSKLAILESVVLDSKEPCHVRIRGAHQTALIGAANETTNRWQETNFELVFITSSPVDITVERNRKGIKLLECQEIVKIDDDELIETNGVNRGTIDHKKTQHSTGLNEKTERHTLFANWLVEKYGVEYLSRGSGVLDVAGGNGRLSQAFADLGVPTILLDPVPRCSSISTTVIIPKALYGDGSHLTDNNNDTGRLVQNCSVIVGMHPDQATEPIVDMALKLQKEFAILPCCVMPRLFPARRQPSGDPVRSYNSFCQYLLEKADGKHFQVDYLPFIGRNKVIYQQLEQSAGVT